MQFVIKSINQFFHRSSNRATFTAINKITVFCCKRSRLILVNFPAICPSCLAIRESFAMPLVHQKCMISWLLFQHSCFASHVNWRLYKCVSLAPKIDDTVTRCPVCFQQFDSYQTLLHRFTDRHFSGLANALNRLILSYLVVLPWIWRPSKHSLTSLQYFVAQTTDDGELRHYCMECYEYFDTWDWWKNTAVGTTPVANLIINRAHLLKPVCIHSTCRLLCRHLCPNVWSIVVRLCILS